MKRHILVAAAVLVPLAPLVASAQDRPARWQRRSEATVPPITVFHSTQSGNLPTGETLVGGEWLFEISHRFGLIDSGADGFWGLDGPVVNRLGLAYAATDRVLVGILRSNVFDNVDLSAKVRLLSAGRESVPVILAANAGISWNTEAPDGVVEFEDNEMQAYAQLIVNALLGGRVALGVVPSFVHNPDPFTQDTDSGFSLGLNGQVYLAEQVSLFGEWIVSEERSGLEHDTGTFGLELETGGHFFKLVVSNNTRLNPAQHLAGTPDVFGTNRLRFGFNITRILTF